MGRGVIAAAAFFFACCFLVRGGGVGRRFKLSGGCLGLRMRREWPADDSWGVGVRVGVGFMVERPFALRWGRRLLWVKGGPTDVLLVRNRYLQVRESCSDVIKYVGCFVGCIQVGEGFAECRSDSTWRNDKVPERVSSRCKFNILYL